MYINEQQLMTMDSIELGIHEIFQKSKKGSGCKTCRGITAFEESHSKHFKF